MSRQVLIIDDDAELGVMLTTFLGGEGLAVRHVTLGDAGLAAIRGQLPDAVVLDVMLPDMSGFDVLRAIRAASQVPVIMLTARGEDTDRIIGLELGADDYLPKPFNPRELAARLRAVLRRTAGEVADQSVPTLAAGELELDPRSRRATLDGEPLRLTGAEFAILECLLIDPGAIVSRDVLAEHALGRRLTPYDRSIDTHVSRLRTKLGPLASGEPRIQSQRGRGYRYVPEAP